MHQDTKGHLQVLMAMTSLTQGLHEHALHVGLEFHLKAQLWVFNPCLSGIVRFNDLKPWFWLLPWSVRLLHLLGSPSLSRLPYLLE